MVKFSAEDIMSPKVISVTPGTTLVEAANLLALHHFDGMPVVDAENKLLGILTEYDLLGSAAVNLPTFQVVMQGAKIFPEDKEHLEKEMEKLSVLIVKDVMNTDPLTLTPDASYAKVLAAFADHHRVNPVPVVDADKKVVGVISRYDVLKPLREADEFKDQQ